MNARASWAHEPCRSGEDFGKLALGVQHEWGTGGVQHPRLLLQLCEIGTAPNMCTSSMRRSMNAPVMVDLEGESDPLQIALKVTFLPPCVRSRFCSLSGPSCDLGTPTYPVPPWPPQPP